jgi:excisionase family DNA binding protein
MSQRPADRRGMSHTLMHRDFLTVTEYAAHYRLAVPTVYRWVAQGRIPAVRPGGTGPIRIPVEALDPRSAPAPVTSGRAVEVGAARGEAA